MKKQGFDFFELPPRPVRLQSENEAEVQEALFRLGYRYLTTGREVKRDVYGIAILAQRKLTYTRTPCVFQKGYLAGRVETKVAFILAMAKIHAQYGEAFNRSADPAVLKKIQSRLWKWSQRMQTGRIEVSSRMVRFRVPGRKEDVITLPVRSRRKAAAV